MPRLLHGDKSHGTVRKTKHQQSKSKFSSWFLLLNIFFKIHTRFLVGLMIKWYQPHPQNRIIGELRFLGHIWVLRDCKGRGW